MNTTFDNEIRLKLLSLLYEKPQLTQREMNQKLGVSLGKVNYCISTLIDRGMVRVERFKKHKNKTAYIYNLTPKGVDSLTRLTLSFLKLKIKEYDGIKDEIRELSKQMNKIDPKVCNDPEVTKNLKKII